MSQEICVIVPTYNRLPILQKCIRALSEQTFPLNKYQILVIAILKLLNLLLLFFFFLIIIISQLNFFYFIHE